MFGLSQEEIISSIKPVEIINKSFIGKKPLKGISLDSRELQKGQGFIAIKGRNFDGHDFFQQAYKKGSSLLIGEYVPKGISAKIDVPIFIVKDTLLALGELAKSLRLKYAPFVCAVTGSLGKTTVKDMIYHILKDDIKIIKNHSSQNNHIGLPKTLLRLNKDTRICVLELGTNHFGEIAYLAKVSQPTITILTCIDDVHLEFFKDRQGVLKEKSSIFSVCPDTFPVLNGDDVRLRRLKTEVAPFYFGKSSGNDVYYEFVERKKDSLIFRINSKYILRLNTLAWFNIYNAMAALSCCFCLGKSLKKSVQALSEFEFPYMRFQLKERRGIRFINDAYNSSPTALKKALDAVRRINSSRKIVVLADMLELGEKSEYFHQRVVRDIAGSNIDYVIFLGGLMKSAAKQVLKEDEFKKNLFFVDDLDKARDRLWQIVKRDDLVFLKGSRKFALEKILET